MIVSLVIPIYNGEHYCRALFDNILAQEYNDFEVLIINDGSIDNTEKICSEYCKRNSRFHLINQKHQGLPAARNEGIIRASGDYIWFVDSDDLLVEDTISVLSNYIQLQQIKPDILFANAEMFSEESILKNSYFYRYNTRFIRSSNADRLMCYLWSDLDLAWSVWRHWFCTDFLKNNNLFFDENQIVYESTGWLLEVIMAAKHYDALQKIIYRYRIDNEQSIIHRKFNLELFMYAYNITVKWFRFFQNHYHGYEARGIMMKKFAQQYRYLSSKVPLLGSLERRKAVMALKANIDIVQYIR